MYTQKFSGTLRAIGDDGGGWQTVWSGRFSDTANWAFSLPELYKLPGVGGHTEIREII